MRLLNLPLPIFAAALDQIDPAQVSGPAWTNSFLIGAFVVLWFLNAIGRLPGAASSERREASFKDEDRTTLEAVHAAVTREDFRFRDEDRRRLEDVHGVVTREDSDKPGWKMAWHSSRETREIRDLLIELSDLREDWATDREECRKERAAAEARQVAEREEWRAERSSMATRITHLEEVNRTQGVALQRGSGD